MNRIGATVCLSIETLFYELGEYLEFTTIEHTPSEDNNPNHEYFDLYNDENILVCMDGEEVLIVEDNGDTLTFRNENGAVNVEFTLTLTEFKIAYYG